MSKGDAVQKGTSEMQGWSTQDTTEFISALLMALATVASAWCGYSATLWHSHQSILMAETNSLRGQASRKLNLAGQEAVIDITMFEQLYRALIEGRADYAQRALRRFRPEARVAVDAWLATDPLQNPSAPSGPFRMKEYEPRLAEEAEALNQQADKKFDLAREASRNADNYTLLTVMLALVLFFAGLTTHFSSPRVQRGVLLLGALQFLAALLTLIKLPVV